MDHAAAQRVDGPVVDDPEDPRPHRAAGAVVARVRPPQREERLLHDLLGGHPLAGHPVGEGEGRSINEQRQRRQPAAGASRDSAA